MKYDYLERISRTTLVEKYSDFFYVLQKQLGGVIQTKFVKQYISHSSQFLDMLCEVGLLKRIYFSSMVIYQIRYCEELKTHSIPKITRDMIVRSALKMEHYHKLGFKTFEEIRAYGKKGNNISANVNKEILEAYNTALQDRGIYIENLTSDESVSVLYRLKTQNIFIDKIKIKDKLISPKLSLYNINIDKPKKMADRIAFAYSEIKALFTDFATGIEAEPEIYIHEFGDKEMFNSIVKNELITSHFQEMGCFDLDALNKKVKFAIYSENNNNPYSRLLN